MNFGIYPFGIIFIRSPNAMDKCAIHLMEAKENYTRIFVFVAIEERERERETNKASMALILEQMLEGYSP